MDSAILIRTSDRAFYLTSDNEEAKDIIQDVFLAAYSGYQSYKGNSSAKTWLYSILKNRLIIEFNGLKIVQSLTTII